MESSWETQKKKPTTRGKRGETGRPPDGLTAAPSGTQQSARSQGLCQTVSVKVWPSSSQLTNCTQTITTNHLGPDEWNAAINRPRFLISGNTTPPCDEDKKIYRLSNQRLWSNNRLPPPSSVSAFHRGEDFGTSADCGEEQLIGVTSWAIGSWQLSFFFVNWPKGRFKYSNQVHLPLSPVHRLKTDGIWLDKLLPDKPTSWQHIRPPSGRAVPSWWPSKRTAAPDSAWLSGRSTSTWPSAPRNSSRRTSGQVPCIPWRRTCAPKKKKRQK